MKELTKQMKEEISYCNQLIEKLWKMDFKCYITKGTGYSVIIKEDKAVILDLASPNFKKNAEEATEAVRLLWIQEQIRKTTKQIRNM